MCPVTELNEAELLEALARRGRPASRARLARWRQAGLLSATTQSLGRGHGTCTMYACSAVDQATAIGDELTRSRSLAVVGWRLWLRGFSIADQLWREPILKAANTIDKVFGYFRMLEGVDGVTRDDDRRYSASDRLVERIQRHEGSALLRRARKACGERRFATFVDFIVQFGAGTYHGCEDPRDGRYELSTLDAAFGFTQARKSSPAGGAPWLPIDYRPELAAVSFALSHGQLIDDLEAASAAEVKACVDQLDRLWTALHAFLCCGELAYGRQWLGLMRVATFLSDRSVHAQAGMAILWLRLRPTLGADAERFIGEHETTVRLAGEMARQEIVRLKLPMRTTTQHWPEAMLAVARGEAVS